jgi:coenzyme Q-binding protein COQ10
MPKYSVTRTMGYPARQLFDIAADVDNYRKFLPLVKSSRAYDVQPGENGGRSFKGELLIQYMRLHIREKFVSNVTIDPVRLVVESRSFQGPVEHLISSWRFTDRQDGGCDVEFNVDYQLKRRAIQFLVSGMFDMLVRKIHTAFEARAFTLYGPPSPLRRTPAASA